MINNYRVVLGYLRKVAQDTITPEQKRKLLENIKKEPSYASDYLDQGSLKPEDEGVKQALLEIIKKDPSLIFPYESRKWLTHKEMSEDEGVKQAVLKHIKRDQTWVKDFIDFSYITTKDEGVKQLLLSKAIKDPSWFDSYFAQDLLGYEDKEVRYAIWEAAKEYPNLLKEVIKEGWLKPKKDEEFKECMLDFLKKHTNYLDYSLYKGWIKSEDANPIFSKLFDMPVEDFSHSHSSNLAVLQKLRSLAKKNGGKVGVIPQFKSLFSGREFLTVADIDKLIDKDKKHNKSKAYEFDHNMWGKHSGQNSFKEDQLVIQVKSLPASIQSEIDSTDYLKKFMSEILKLSKKSGHPRAYGWARVHVKDKDTWVIDEIQSDVIKAYNDLASNRGYAERLKENAPLIMNNLPAIGAFVKKHFKDIRDVIISAVRERAHKTGVNNIEHMNVEFKVKQNLKVRRDAYDDHEKGHPVKVLDSEGKIVDKTKGEVKLRKDTPIPAHYVYTYLKDLVKDGFERDEQTQRFKIHSSLDWFLGNHD